MQLRGCSHVKEQSAIMYDHISKMCFLVCGPCANGFLLFKGYTIEYLSYAEETELRRGNTDLIRNKMDRIEVLLDIAGETE